MSRRPSPEAAAPAPRRKLGVVLVDPLPVVRAGLALLIDERADMEVLAEAGEGLEALEVFSRVRRSRVVVLVGLGLDQRGSADTGLPAPLPPTPYARFGDGLFLGLWLCGAVVLVLAAWRRRRGLGA